MVINTLGKPRLSKFYDFQVPFWIQYHAFGFFFWVIELIHCLFEGFLSLWRSSKNSFAMSMLVSFFFFFFPSDSLVPWVFFFSITWSLSLFIILFFWTLTWGFYIFDWFLFLFTVLSSRPENVSNFVNAESIFGPVIIAFHLDDYMIWVVVVLRVHRIGIDLVYCCFSVRMFGLCTSILQHYTSFLYLIVQKMSWPCLTLFKVHPLVTWAFLIVC